MARLNSVTDIPERIQGIARTHAVKVSRRIGDRLVDLAHELGLKSPVDTSRLLSNFLIGSREDDFPTPRPWHEGKDGSTRESSLGAQGLHNIQIIERDLKAMRGGTIPRVRWRLENRTPYIPYVIRRIGDYISPIVTHRVAQLRQAYRTLTLQDR